MKLKLLLIRVIKYLEWVLFKRREEFYLNLTSSIGNNLAQLLVANQNNLVELVKSTQVQNDLIIKWLTGTIPPLPSGDNSVEVKPLIEDDDEWVPLGDISEFGLPPEFELAFQLENDDK